MEKIGSLNDSFSSLNVDYLDFYLKTNERKDYLILYGKFGNNKLS